jgi:cytochrome c
MLIRFIGIVSLGLSLVLGLSSCQKQAESDDKPLGASNQSTSSESVIETPTNEDSSQFQARIKSLPSPLDQADYMNGKAQFIKCRSCHTISPEGGNLTGPSLYGIYGQKAGSIKDYNYSEAMKSQNLNWDYAALDTYLTKPNAMVKGTKMAFAGIKKHEDRRDLIAYLALQSDEKAEKNKS